MTYRELVEKEKSEYVGRKVLYKGEKHTVVDVDYNGGLLIDLPTQFTETTAISRFDRDLEFLPVKMQILLANGKEYRPTKNC